MKLAFSELLFEVNNTGSLKNLLADVQISGRPLALDAFVAVEPKLYAEPIFGKFQFFAHRILKNHGKLTPDVPVLLNRNISEVSNIIARVRLAYRTTPVVYSSVVTVIGAGASNKDVLGNFGLKKKFLNYQPTTKVVDRKQNDFLYWLHDAANYSQYISTITAMYEVKYDDGSIASVTGGNIDVSESAAVFCVPTGYWAVASAEVTGKEIVSWSVRLCDNFDNIISERRTYLLAAVQDIPATYVLFRNSWGIFDSIRFDGTVANSIETTSQTALDGTNAVSEFDTEGYDLVKVNSGRLGRGWLDYLKELMLSEEIYLVKNAQLVKVVKNQKSLGLTDTMKRDDVATLEFRVAKNERYY